MSKARMHTNTECKNVIIVPVQIAAAHKTKHGMRRSVRMTIRDLGVEYYQQDYRDDGTILCTPVNFIKDSVGSKTEE